MGIDVSENYVIETEDVNKEKVPEMKIITSSCKEHIVI